MNGRGAGDVASCSARRPHAILRLVPLVKRNATYDDLCALPDHMVAEIIDGDLFASPRPASPHALASSMLGAALIGSFGGEPGGAGVPGGWWILLEPELHLAEDVLVPDRAGWRRDRLPVFPETPAFTHAPDWVCEVISPSTGRIDRSRKMRSTPVKGCRICGSSSRSTRTCGAGPAGRSARAGAGEARLSPRALSR